MTLIVLLYCSRRGEAAAWSRSVTWTLSSSRAHHTIDFGSHSQDHNPVVCEENHKRLARCERTRDTENLIQVRRDTEKGIQIGGRQHLCDGPAFCPRVCPRARPALRLGTRLGVPHRLGAQRALSADIRDRHRGAKVWHLLLIRPRREDLRRPSRPHLPPDPAAHVVPKGVPRLR
jgi:hypothetical protein